MYHLTELHNSNPDGGNESGNPAGQDNSEGTVTVTGGNPNNSPDGRTCLMQGTTTVFVTVLPTSPQTSEGDAGENTGSDQTAHVTVHPTETVQVSPLASATEKHSVKPFTTLTIDIWGDGSNHPIPSWDASPVNTGSPPSGQSSVKPSTYNGDGNSPPLHTGSDSSDEGSARTQETGTFMSGTPTYGTAGTAQSNSEPADQATGSQTPQYTVVTDTNVEWTTNSDGVTPLTVLSEHTITFEGASPTGSSTDASWTSWTVTGLDGKPTIVESSVNAGQPSNDAPVSTVVVTQPGGSPAQAVATLLSPQSPVTTVTALISAPAFPQSVLTTCTSYTVLGTDGIPTVVHSTRVIPRMSITSASNSFSTDSASAHGLTQGSPEGSDVTSCTSYTIIGTDGRQTVVESTLVIPASAASASWLPQNLPNGMPGPITSLPNALTDSSPNSMPSGVTAASTYTIVGPDGQLTVVDVTYIIPGPSPTSAWASVPSEAITGVPNPVTATATASGFSPQDMTTCVSYTAIGTDGRPTVVESTVILPVTQSPANTFIPFPSVVPQGQASGLPQGTASGSVDGQNQGLATCITIDVLGSDGKATPTVETIVVSPADAAPNAASPITSTLGLPSFVPQALTDMRQGLPPSQSGGGITISAATLTVVGPNGQLSPVVQTVVLTPAASPPTANSGVLAPQPLSSMASVSGPVLQEYGNTDSGSIPFPSAAVSGVDDIPAGNAKTSAPVVFTIITGPGGIPALSAVTASLPLPYGSSDGHALPLAGQTSQLPQGAQGAQNTQGGYGWLPAGNVGQASPGSYGLPAPLSSLQTGGKPTSLQTSTWVNLIPEPTTTYTMKFPLTTLATVKVPGLGSPLHRFVRRQARFVIGCYFGRLEFSNANKYHSNVAPSVSWSNSSTAIASLPENTSLGASLTSALEATVTPPSPANPSASVPTTPTASTGSSGMCPTGGQIGNITLNVSCLNPCHVLPFSAC